jgi:hypothetical protein
MLFKETITYTVRYLPKSIVINGRSINQINISSHCDKHKKEGVTNEKIVELAELLDKGEFEIDGEDNKKIYFKTYHLYENKTYKLVW